MGEKGDIGSCPNCLSKMRLGMAPFKYHGSYIGLFEAYICDYCNRRYFTENAYKEIKQFPFSLKDTEVFSEEIKQTPITVFTIPILIERPKRKSTASSVPGRVIELIDLQISEESKEENQTAKNSVMS